MLIKVISFVHIQPTSTYHPLRPISQDALYYNTHTKISYYPNNKGMYRQKQTNNTRKLNLFSNLHELRVDKIKINYYQYHCNFITQQNLSLQQKMEQLNKISNIKQILYDKIGCFGIYKESLLGRLKCQSISFLEDQLDINAQVVLAKECWSQELLQRKQGKVLFLQLIKPRIDEIVMQKKVDYKEFLFNNTTVVYFPLFKYGFKEHQNILYFEPHLVIQVHQKQSLLSYIDTSTDKKLIGRSLIKNYNQQHQNILTILDIQYDKNPTSKLTSHKQSITFAEYYHQKYNITIKDMKQPLVLVQDGKIRRFGESHQIYMIPELVSIDLSLGGKGKQSEEKITKIIDQQMTKKQKYMSAFIHGLAQQQMIKKSTLNLNAFPVSNPQIAIQSKQYRPEEGIFDFRGKLYKSVDISNWAIAYSQKGDGSQDQNEARKLLQLFKNVCSQYGVKMKAQPGVICTGSTPESWMTAIKKDKEQYGTPQILVLFLREEEQHLHGQLNKKITSIFKFPCLAIKRSLVDSQNKRPHQQTSNILLKLQALIGGIPWIVVHDNHFSQQSKFIHGSCYIQKESGKWNITFVGSNNSQGTGFYSYHKSLIQTIATLQVQIQSVILCWIKNFVINCKMPPEIIILYVSVDDQHLFGQIMPLLIAKINNLGKKIGDKVKMANYEPSISLIEVQSNHKTQIYVSGSNEKGDLILQKAPASICITELCKQNQEEFYLNSQKSSNPTKYSVVKRGKNITYENLIDFTHAQCYNCFTIRESIKIPAYLEYSHKLNKLAKSIGLEIELEDKMSRVAYFL